MTKHISFQVLADNRLIFKILNIYNKNGVRIGTYKVPNKVFQILSLLPTIIGCIGMIQYCFDSSLNFGQVSSSMAVLLGTVQIATIFLTLAIKKDTIIKTVNKLQEVVDKSKAIQFFKPYLYNEIYLFKILGSEKSRSSCTVYEIYEKINSRVVLIFRKCAVFVIVTSFLVAAFIPVMSFIFGYPTFEYWILPLDMK